MIRIAAKAIVIENDKLLVLENKYKDEIYYTLPGGGQNHKEDLHQALKRECLEEIGVDVEVKELLFVSEFIAERHNVKVISDDHHQIDMFFSCVLVGNVNSHGATEMDQGQIGFKWLDINKINCVTLYPLALKKHLRNLNTFNDNIYLGEVR